MNKPFTNTNSLTATTTGKAYKKFKEERKQRIIERCIIIGTAIFCILFTILVVVTNHG